MHPGDPQRLLRHLVSVGARPGEIDALRWAQVDLDVRKITIDRAIKRADGGRPLSIGSDEDRAPLLLAYDAVPAGSVRSRTVPDVIDQHRSEIEGLCQRFGVARLEVFGSALGEDFDFGTSDIDFLVEFTDPSSLSYADDYFGLKEALEAVFDRRVDLITRPSVRNPYLLARIEATGELVYAR